MFSICSELTPRAPIPDSRIAQFMQVDWPTQLTLVICISWSITNTSKIYKRTLQGYLLGKLESTQSKFSYAWIWYRSTISFIFMAWHTRLTEDLKFHIASLWEKISLLAPKVLLDYLRPMITIHPTNPIPSHRSNWHIAVKMTSPQKI